MTQENSLTISGTTRVVYVIADPIFQVRTPQAQNAEWRERGADLVTIPAHVDTLGLSAFVDSMRVNRSAAGAVVTVPHKPSIAAHLDVLGPNAQLTGAVNAVRRRQDGTLEGETFDGEGFIAGLLSEGIDPTGMAVRILGAGGAASAVAVALARHGASSIRVQNRTRQKAEDLVARVREGLGFEKIGHWEPGGLASDLIINATSLGMSPGEEVSFDLSGAAADATAADVIVSDVDTPFLAAAAEVGLRTHAGRHMLIGQMNLLADYLLQAD